MIVFGLYVLISTGGVSLSPLSFIRVGSIEAGGLPVNTTTQLFVGAVILLAGVGMATKGFSKTRSRK